MTNQRKAIKACITGILLFNYQPTLAHDIDLTEIKVSAERDHLIGMADSASEGIISEQRIANVPLSRPGEILEQVPGLVVSQHSGDGKANQYYLRGFNLDHGTDFSLMLDGMPLNMPTHAHGQGYIDANWLIPELIEQLSFRKGPYHAEQGDFSAAGSAHLHYVTRLPASMSLLTHGSYGFNRLLNAGSQPLADGELLYAIEAQRYDGAWKNDQNLRKLNGLVRYTTGDASHGWDITAMAYDNQWEASDQVPRRAVRTGKIDRFGTIDPTSGGATSRYSLSAAWHHDAWQANVYAMRYALDLFSNFTYFLDDPINGDQFQQVDKRHVFGGAITRSANLTMAGLDTSHQFGLQSRMDAIDEVGLYKTIARQRLRTVRQDRVKQTSIGAWWQGHWQLHPKLRASTGLRHDLYQFDVTSNISQNDGKATRQITSPKLGLAWNITDHHELYANWGNGFHSNDGRGVKTRIDPATGEAVSPVDALVRATGQEVGWRANPVGAWQTTLALFSLKLDSERLFIGDAGATEAGRPSQRVGIEWTNYLPINAENYIDSDFSLTRARFSDRDASGEYIPGAVAKTASMSWVKQWPHGFSTATRIRYLGPRPLIENNRVRSNSTLLTNVRIAYQVHPKMHLALDLLNLFNRKVSDIDYFYTSRLRGETAEGVDDIHTHPAEPRMARLTMTLNY